MGRIRFKYGINDVNANLDGLIVYYSPKYGRNIARRYTKPKVTAEAVAFGSKQKHLGGIWREASSAYRQDMKIYAGLLAQETGRLRPPFILFVKMGWNWQAANPGDDILNLSRQRIIDEAIPLRSVAEAIAAGFLESVSTGGFGENLI
jgi:hypothetical protein